ncbi:MAG: ISNCY family transposase [Telluria sp.]
MLEIDRLTVIRDLVRCEITTLVAAYRLGVSTRQVRRLLDRFGEAGPAGLVSRQRGTSSNHQLAPGLAQTALATIREHYADFGPTLATEKLRELHGIKLAKETVRRIMIEDGLWKTREQRLKRLHQPRTRRECLGDLVQIDGSLHHWFEERGVACSLLVFVDDATGCLMQLHFALTESAMSYFAATRGYLLKHGKPHTFYSDRAGVFRALRQGKHETQTQFHRALSELDIDLICASSPQAKGRVERMNRSLQDRLVKELRLEGISTIEDANAWSDGFIEDYNRRFAQPPVRSIDLHRTISKREDLDLILAWREDRKLTKNLTVQNKEWIYVVADTTDARALVGRQISIHTSPDGTTLLRGEGLQLRYTVQPVTRKPPLPIEVDCKNLAHVLAEARRPRKRGYVPTTAQKQSDLLAAKALAAKNREQRRTAEKMRKKPPE